MAANADSERLRDIKEELRELKATVNRLKTERDQIRERLKSPETESGGKAG